MRRWRRFFLVAVVAMLAGAPDALAQAQKRFALLVGNQGYSDEIGKLDNPHNDIARLEKALKSLTFDVRTVADAGFAALQVAVNAHTRRVRAAGPGSVSFFYYAGHGAADARNVNYLIPVDVKSSEEHILWDQSLRLNVITRQLKEEADEAVHFVVFDACRNVLKLRRAGTRAPVQVRGYASMAQERGMLIAYATAEGETASDGCAYAAVLAEEIVKPGVEAVAMFRAVQLRVRKATGEEPWMSQSALGEVYLAGLAPKGDPAGPPPGHAGAVVAPPGAAAQAWALAKDSASIPVLEAYRRQHGADAFYDQLAKERIERLKREAEAGERERVALLQRQEEERQRAEAKRKADEEAARRDPALAVKPGSGESFRDRQADGRPCPECPEMVVVPAGSFTMGSPESEAERSNNEGPQRTVRIARPFAVGRFEVTFAEWDACVSEKGCSHSPKDDWGRGKQPVMRVSWDDIAQQYLPWLSRMTGKTYRLLTEAEREYVARAGTTTPFWWGASISTGQANYNGNYTYGGGAKGKYRQRTVQVDSFAANPWGLYNVHGNVWEWVQDCWNDNYNGAPPDGSARTTGDCGRRVLRGASWFSYPGVLRSAVRNRFTPDFRDNHYGFRVGRTF
jgi:formylglycine-generating enzyme required for sulfatase activity